MSVDVDIRQLLEAGAHFGHKTSRWHPAMNQYIHSVKDGTHIIDLTKTVEGLEKALAFTEIVASQGKQILFVSTKRQAKDIVKAAALSVDMPYVTERWLGGMLTNGNTINARIKYLKANEEKMANGELAAKYNKLEVQRYQEEIDMMNVKFGGIKNLTGKPGAIIVVDVPNELNAVAEARKLGVPIIGIVDTNADPRIVDYVIPANDDAVKAIQLICNLFVQAIEAGRVRTAKAIDKTEATEPTPVSA